jgi:hypothetical protein
MFWIGVPSPLDIERYRAVYYKDTKSFVTNIMKSFAESNDWVQNRLKWPYIQDRIYDVKGFKERVKSTLDNFRIVETFMSSVMLIGQKDDSFSKS